MQVLLSKEAETVYAIDVGHDQLAPELRQNPRLVNLKGAMPAPLQPSKYRTQWILLRVTYLSFL